MERLGEKEILYEKVIDKLENEIKDSKIIESDESEEIENIIEDIDLE